MLRGEESALGSRILALEVVAYFFHRNPLHPFLAVDVFDQACLTSVPLLRLPLYCSMRGC